VFEITETATSV